MNVLLTGAFLNVKPIHRRKYRRSGAIRHGWRELLRHAAGLSAVGAAKHRRRRLPAPCSPGLCSASRRRRSLRSDRRRLESQATVETEQTVGRQTAASDGGDVHKHDGVGWRGGAPSETRVRPLRLPVTDSESRLRREAAGDPPSKEEKHGYWSVRCQRPASIHTWRDYRWGRRRRKKYA